MVFVVMGDKINAKTLQQQEEKKIRIPPDEQKDVTHLKKVTVSGYSSRLKK